MGVKLQGKISCFGCVLVKTRKILLSKKNKIKSTKKGEMVSIITKGAYPVNPSGKKYCICGVGYFSNMSWVNSTLRKINMMQFVKKLV